MSSFIGTYSNTIDDNNRFSLPAKLRKSLNELGEFNLVISKGQANYLKLYPYSYWERHIAERMRQLPPFDPEADILRRHVGETTAETKIDKQGRISIPSDYYEHVAIKKTVTIIGSIDSIQLWNPETHAQTKQEVNEAGISAALSKFGL